MQVKTAVHAGTDCPKDTARERLEEMLATAPQYYSRQPGLRAVCHYVRVYLDTGDLDACFHAMELLMKEADTVNKKSAAAAAKHRIKRNEQRAKAKGSKLKVKRPSPR
jgi:hypothetical protein